ncbi:TLC domain-containing protein [Ditylenchus destructor]|uniref:TLC domain-containing protein n=1 Tax=Ditylenchus destructor TaxID=166010 RepID=A0AAD4R2U6_9BILA|nr:TLC domain-containing protein [Ditylenchus destructor]
MADSPDPCMYYSLDSPNSIMPAKSILAAASTTSLDWITAGWGIHNILSADRRNQRILPGSGWNFSILNGFWSAEYWLPAGNSWQDLPVKYTDLVWPILLALPILAIRIAFEHSIGKALDWSRTTHSKSLLASMLRSIVTLPRAKNLKRKKMLEHLWRLVAYIGIVVYGFVVLADRPWLYDLKECWMNYPQHSVDSTLWWYYMLQTAFYYSLLYSCAFDVRRSDFLEICIHHVVTIGLLSFSWATNFIRVGTLVLLVHDISDIVLEMTKYLRYSGKSEAVVNVGFVAFLLSWIATRVFYLPFVLMRSAIFEAPAFIQPDYSLFLSPLQKPFGPRVMIYLLFALLGLHLFWTVLIIKIVCRTLSSGKAEDVREDDEEEENEICTENHKKVFVPQKRPKKIERSCKARKGDPILGLAKIDDLDTLKSFSDGNACMKENLGDSSVCFYGCYCKPKGYVQRMKILKTRRMLNELRKRG